MFIKIPKYANEWRSCVILCMYYKFISKCSWGLCSAGHHIHYDCTPLFVCSQFSKSDRVNILFSSVSVDWTSAWLGCIQLPALPGMFQWSGRLDAMAERLHVVLERTSLDWGKRDSHRMCSSNTKLFWNCSKVEQFLVSHSVSLQNRCQHDYKKYNNNVSIKLSWANPTTTV